MRRNLITFRLCNFRLSRMVQIAQDFGLVAGNALVAWLLWYTLPDLSKTGKNFNIFLFFFYFTKRRMSRYIRVCKFMVKFCVVSTKKTKIISK